MPAVKRLHPKDIFDADDWRELSKRSWWRGIYLAGHAWGVIGLSVAAVELLPNPITYLLAVMVIGTRQLGLAILMHEAAHGTLHLVPAINDFLGEWVCGQPIGASLKRYRPYHLQHHKFAQQAEDPDLGLSAKFPTTPASLRRKVIRDLTGQTFFKQRVKPYLGFFDPQIRRSARFQAFLRSEPRFLACNAVMALVAIGSGHGLAFLGLWIVPMATWYPLVTRIRNIAEHACVGDGSDPFRQARTTRASWIERAFIAPYYVNFHSEHHLFMHISCWNLPKAHQALGRKGHHDSMEICQGYAAVLRQVAPRS